jgi:hypothetical protein
MSDRTFNLILDGKKRGLVKGSTPSSAAKKAYKKLSAESSKTSFKFELQETTKDSKKKVYGPYKGCLDDDKIKVKMAGGEDSGNSRTRPPPFTVMSGGVFLKDRIKHYTVEKIDRDFFEYELKYWLPRDHFFWTVYNGALFGDRIPVRVKSIKKINDDNTDGENIDNEFIIGKIAIVVANPAKMKPNVIKELTAALQLSIQNEEMNNALDILIDNRDRTIDDRKKIGLNKLTFIN